VGFPGETEADFAQTLQVVERARFANAFTFQYSARPGTPAATMSDQVPKDVVRERYDRLIEVQDAIAWSENQRMIGREVEVLVTREGRKNHATGRMSGRARDGRLVHVASGADGSVGPGDLVRSVITYAAPHHLVADGPLLAYRRWAGEAVPVPTGPTAGRTLLPLAARA
jgi:tRNA-2-methylthio-N6-dimethylallyladenosine synthase